MAGTPLYGFYRRPRFSANHIAEYICKLDARQREAVIRRAKFPKKAQVVAYQTITSPIRHFLASNTGDLTRLDGAAKTLSDKADHPSEYARDEARRCLAMLEAFKATFMSAKMAQLTFQAGPSDLALKIEGVSLNIRLDAVVSDQAKNGEVYEGGCAMYMAASPDARKDIVSRLKTAAGIIHWAIESQRPNTPTLPRLCMAVDIHGGSVTRASDSNVILRRRIEASCREAARGWDDVEPPADYDGPEWRLET